MQIVSSKTKPLTLVHLKKLNILSQKNAGSDHAPH